MYQVPESKRSLAQNQYEFTTDGKNKFRIPKLQYLPLSVVEDADKKGGIYFRSVLELLGETEAADAVRALDAEQIGHLALDWQEASAGITPGESSASTDS